MLAEQLKEKGVKNTLIDGVEHFDVKDIKDNHPDLKIDVKKILIVDKISYITADCVEEVTEFDKIFKSIFNSKN